MNRLRQFINYRPLSILAMAGAARDFFLGIGFLVGWDQITQTLIFQNYDNLVPGYSGYIVGAILILVGMAVTWASARYSRVWMSNALKVQSLVWMFSTLTYVLNGQILLALIFGVFFMLPAGYIAFYVKYHPSIDEQMKQFMRA